MKASSAGGSGVHRNARRTAKVIHLPAPRRRHRRTARAGAVVVALAVIGAMAARIDGLHNARIQATSLRSPLAAEEFRVLKLINDLRVKAGIAPLQFSPRLMVAARNHSRDMAVRGYLGHDSPAGDTPADRIRAAGVNYDELSENVYRSEDSAVEAVPQSVVTAWTQNRAFRSSMLSPAFRLSAAGISRADDGDYYITLDLVR